MGVPAFFRWLSTKYPSIVTNCVEKHGPIIDNNGTRGPVDTTEPNPNGIEFDNLYLDMNGIIHPCTHPENKPAPKNEPEMFVAIFEYIDRLFAIIRPRRVLYMAIDGVAPRAKMNQQRSRRFRAAQESREKRMTIERLRQELLARGAYLPAPKSDEEHFDSNCITPGTPFMARLAVALRYYIYNRLNSHPGWKNLIVYLSDANAPGEGEHKIMDFIRRQRCSPTHDANTRHCLCGADADLIMLGLATHEPHFTIIREEFKPNQPRPCELCGEFGHEMEDCVGTAKDEEKAFDSTKSNSGAEPEFIFIRLNVLREYLTKDLELPGITFEWDLERVIDDWVFMCFFVGNDFLPHLPSLEIREGAIDRLIELYKSAVQSTGGWLTDSGKVHMERVQLIMVELGKMEDEIFKKRRESELNFRERKRRQAGRPDFSRPQHHSQSPRWQPVAPESGLLKPVALQNRYGVAHPQGRSEYRSSVTADEVRQARYNRHSGTSSVNWVEQNLHNLEAATAMKAMLRPSRKSGEKSYPGALADTDNDNSDAGPSPSRKPRLEVTDQRGRLGGAGADAVMKKLPKDADYTEEDVADANDDVRLWEDGWRSRYYESKFGVVPEDAPEFCIQVGREYARGLCWVLAYYYQGCASWDWYFPYHYAPFASDFVGISDLNPGFDLVETKPFRPLEQLMGVFPADSRSHVPPAWQDLMTDPNSPIIDFYPTDFKVDLNGKRYLWMGVALLPFVDEVRLLKALDERRCKLMSEELDRNVRGPDRLFCSTEHPLCALLESLYARPNNKSREENETPENNNFSVIDPRLTHGIAGQIWPDRQFGHLPGSTVPSGVPSLLPVLKSCQAISVCFADPTYPKGFHFPARLLDSVKMPPPSHLQPSQQRGRGRGRGRGSFNDSDRRNDDRPSGRFNNAAAMQYYARDNSHDRDQSHQPSAMNRMLQHNLPPRFRPPPPSSSSSHSYNSRDSRFDSRRDRYSSHSNEQHVSRGASHFRPNNYGRGGWNEQPRQFYPPQQHYNRPRYQQQQHHPPYYHPQRDSSSNGNFRRPYRY